MQGIPSEMYLRVEAQRGDTNTHRTALIVNKAKPHFVKYQRGHIFTPQPELESWAIFSTPSEGKVAGMVALPAGKPSKKYQISTQTLLSMFRMQVTVVSQ